MYYKIAQKLKTAIIMHVDCNLFPTKHINEKNTDLHYRCVLEIIDFTQNGQYKRTCILA